MRSLLTVITAALLTLAVAGFAGAKTSTQTYRGTATGLDGKFRYGAVTVKRSGAKITFVEIKAISATCAGQSLLRTIVYRSSSRAMKIIKGSNRVKSGVMNMTFLPETGVPENKIIIRISFSGKNANGQFNENGLCYDVGKFKAKR